MVSESNQEGANMTKLEQYVAQKQREYGAKFDASALAQQFNQYFENGQRVEVEFVSSDTGEVYETKRGRIGVTTGWRPCFPSHAHSAQYR